MLTQTLVKVTRLLQESGIPYMVIGGYAVLYHGEARFTEDIDITLGVDIDKLNNILDALGDSFHSRTENTADFVRKTNVLPLIDSSTSVPVDLIFSFIDFERNAIKRAVNTDVNKNSVKIISAEDLIIYKIFAARKRDLEDAASIFNRKADFLNIAHIDEKIKELSLITDNPDLIKSWKEIQTL